MKKILFGIFAVILLFISCNNSPSGQKNGNQNNPDNGDEQNPGDGEQDDKLYQIYFESDELIFDLAEEKSLSAVVKDKDGNTIEDALITFSSGKEELLSINENSKAKAKMIGDVVITAAATIDDKEISSTCNCKISSNALDFISEGLFSLYGLNSKNIKPWDGVVYYYSYQDMSWKEWNGDYLISEKIGDYSYLILRGKNNKYFYQENNGGGGFKFDADKIQCNGDIRVLLDYEDVKNAQIGYKCFCGLFSGAPLTSLPNLPSKTLSQYCYSYMFSGCKNLTSIPADYLPATTLADCCYYNMFYGCENLVNAPSLPATELATWCYYKMFSGCKKLQTLPSLSHITTAGDRACQNMFEGCDLIELKLQPLENGVKFNEYFIPISERYEKAYSKQLPLIFNNMFINTKGSWGDGSVSYYAGVTLTDYYLTGNKMYYTSNKVIYPPSEEENN